MKLITPHKYVEVAVELPSSKSISNRVLVINALAGNVDLPRNLSDCDDTRVMECWLRDMPETVDVGAAGTAMRFSTALLSLADGTHIITGSARMKQRPISVLVDSLRQMGANIDYLEKEGYPPLRITGTGALKGGLLELKGNVSSQFVSALLMIGPYMESGLQLHLTDRIISRPYIDMTLSIMNEFGADAKWLTDDTLGVMPCKYVKRGYCVESDWSAASYWYEILMLADGMERIRLNGLYEHSLQGDSAVAKIFESFGINTRFVEEDGMPVAVLTKQRISLRSFEYDFMNQPDIAQTMAVTCCMMDIPFHFYGLASLKIKETDRLHALVAELAKMGFEVEERNSSELVWDGNRRILTEQECQHLSIDTYDDHRMAMSFAPCCLKLGELRVNNPEVVSKSYPSFWDDLNKIGVQLLC